MFQISAHARSATPQVLEIRRQVDSVANDERIDVKSLVITMAPRMEVRELALG